MVFTNCGGQVVFQHTGTPMGFEGTRYFRVTGTGSKSHRYGIVSHATSGGHMFDVNYGGSDGEIDHVEMKGNPTDPLASTPALTGGVGLAFRTYPSCSDGAWTASTFTQYNTSVHDNYIHDTKYEGMYLGPSHWGNVEAHWYNPGFPCSSGPYSGQRLEEASLVNLQVYNNRLENIGSDGIQIGAATSGVVVRDNTVKNWGLNGEGSHSNGIQLGGGTKALVERNRAENQLPRQSSGLMFAGLGGTVARNNVFIGSQNGFMLLRMTEYNVGLTPTEPLNLLGNTVVGVTGNAVQYYCGNFVQIRLINNLLAGYGTASKSDDGLGSACISGTLAQNGFHSTATAAKFVNLATKDLHLQSNSPAVNAGYSLGAELPEDYDGRARGTGGFYHLGAYVFE